MHVVVSERLTACVSNEGAVRSCAVAGELVLAIADTHRSGTALHFTGPADGVQLKVG